MQFEQKVLDKNGFELKIIDLATCTQELRSLNQKKV